MLRSQLTGYTMITITGDVKITINGDTKITTGDTKFTINGGTIITITGPVSCSLFVTVTVSSESRHCPVILAVLRINYALIVRMCH